AARPLAGLAFVWANGSRMNYLLRRLFAAFLTVFAVATLIFLALHLVPGDPAEILLSSGGMAPSPDAVAALRENLGLNQPLLVQYGQYLVRLVRLDFGLSFQDGVPILPEILKRLPRTIELVLTAGVIALV